MWYNYYMIEKETIEAEIAAEIIDDLAAEINAEVLAKDEIEIVSNEVALDIWIDEGENSIEILRDLKAIVAENFGRITYRKNNVVYNHLELIVDIVDSRAPAFIEAVENYTVNAKIDVTFTLL